MNATTRAVLNPLLIVLLLVALLMIFLDIAPKPATVGLAILCVAGLVFIYAKSRFDKRKMRRVRNHRRA